MIDDTENKNETISIDLARKIKELGCNQLPLFIHLELEHLIQVNEETREIMVLETRTITGFAGTCYYDPDLIVNKFPAFTCNELIDILPAYINDYNLTIKKFDVEYEVSYCGEGNQKKFLLIEHDEKLADALGKIFINLIENKMINF
jgi:hypothetical protein